MNRNYAAALLMSAIALSSSATAVMAQQSNDTNSMHGMHMETGKAPAGSATAKIGDLDISGGYVRAMLPGQPVGGGYITIHNGG
ncbi:MAG TPA: copper chaperone PCu(A)C, partial [Rhizobium sp.]